MERKEISRAIVEAESLKDRAFLKRQRDGGISEVYVLILALDTARPETNPWEVGSPFRSFFVADATDNAVEVSIKLNTRDSWQAAFPIAKKDASSWKHQQEKAYIHWTAQAGKSITIYFFVSGNFRPGSTNVEISSAAEGSSYSVATAVAMTTTEAAIVASDSTRGVLNIYNDGGATVFVGNTGLSAANGYPLHAGAFASFKNTGALYGLTLAGTSSIRVLEEA